jgi:DNA-binding MarR family transcriptional regulator
MANVSEHWMTLAKKLHSQHKEQPIRTFRDILILSHATEKYLDIKLSADGTNRTQRNIILSILAKSGYSTPTEISKNTYRTIDTINKSIDGLNKMKLTRSYQSRKDRRIRQVTLTEQGLELAENTLPTRYQAFLKAMNCFSKDESKIFESLLKRLIENIISIMDEDTEASNSASKKKLPAGAPKTSRKTRSVD